MESRSRGSILEGLAEKINESSKTVDEESITGAVTDASDIAYELETKGKLMMDMAKKFRKDKGNDESIKRMIKALTPEIEKVTKALSNYGLSF